MMEGQINPLHKKLRLAGFFIIFGLLIQAVSLLWNHPLSFIAFVTLGGLFLGLGIILYLLALVNIPAKSQEEANTGGAKPPLT